MSHILVTGGLGFIGSHIVTELLQQNHTVVIIDNESNAHHDVLDSITKITSKLPIYHKVDMCNIVELKEVFDMYQFKSVIHLAGLKAVKESVDEPLRYYRTNLNILLNLLEVMEIHKITSLIFSSSATVYGSNLPLFTEDMVTGTSITNPYGKTKHFQEEILKDYINIHPDMSVVVLRYFNPIGAHPSGYITENPSSPPQNLMPILIKVGSQSLPYLQIFGTDYNTPDGTCIRDYIHIIDLAQAHILAMIKTSEPGIHIYNIGTGVGSSVKEIVKTFEAVNNVKIPIKCVDRRPGDLPIYCANISKINRELGWSSKLSLEDMCRDSWRAYLMSQEKN